MVEGVPLLQSRTAMCRKSPLLNTLFLSATAATVLLLAGCRGPRIAGIKESQLHGWYVSSEYSSGRGRVPFENVMFLNEPPKDRRYRVIGYVYPPSKRFRTWGEVFNGARAAASLYGADAVIADQWSEQEGWSASMSSDTAFAGKAKFAELVRAQAIVWE